MNIKEISLEIIVGGWMPIFNKSNEDPLACIELINKDEYKKLRTQINDAFHLDEAPDFTGVVEDETEFGDVTDVMINSLQEKYPPEQCAKRSKDIMLTIDDRTAWRDELIKELDDMVER
jgi:hypothetical protein